MSAYALFFRDTQAAIKGQNPNTSFGEVSKIVASMWDTLETEQKNVSKDDCLITEICSANITWEIWSTIILTTLYLQIFALVINLY